MEQSIDLDKVKNVVEVLVRSKVIDAINETIDHGFGKVSMEVTVQNGVIKLISLGRNQTYQIDHRKENI